MPSPVLELRVALTTEDYDRIAALYTEGLGLEPAALWTSETTRAMLLEMGRGTLEIFDEGHAAEVDRIEVGQRVSSTIRFALQVPDVEAAAKRLIARGAVHEVVITPWGDKNIRPRPGRYADYPVPGSGGDRRVKQSACV
jgi:catechol 2,3-dioxygenase-like lactoylglutathione lyase family enzyme